MTDQQPHTPTATQIREDYAHLRYHFADGWSIGEERVQFDNWLATEIAAAEQRGAEQGWDQCRDSIITAGRDHTEYSSNALDPGLTLTAFLDYTEKALANPYRADQMEGDDE